jgi:uncharacterized membrane protein
VPLEGHWQRVNTPLRTLTRRERRLVRIAAAVVAAIAVAIVVLAASAGTAPPAAGCISATVPGAMGGVTVDACGARARTICRERAAQTDPGSLAVERDCRRAGIG